jgi:hypothetical protein
MKFYCVHTEQKWVYVARFLQPFFLIAVVDSFNVIMDANYSNCFFKNLGLKAVFTQHSTHRLLKKNQINRDSTILGTNNSEKCAAVIYYGYENNLASEATFRIYKIYQRQCFRGGRRDPKLDICQV